MPPLIYIGGGLFKIGDFMFKIIKFLNVFYDKYLHSKLLRFAIKSILFLWCIISFISGNILKGIIKFIVIYIWFTKFTFPWKKKKVCNIVMGPPGSGKSTFAAFISKWASVNNESVYSNLALKNTYEFKWSRDFGTYLIENATIIIDEAALEAGLNNREFKKNFSEKNFRRLETVKLHRHYGLDMWYFSQWDDVDLKIRELAQNYYIMKKTPFSWLLKVKLYKTDIDVDPMTQDFRKIRVHKKTYFLFSPVVWLAFDTEEVPFSLEHKEFTFRDIV